MRPVETQRILQREVLSAYTSNQRLMLQVSQLEQDIQRLELINNQLIAADASSSSSSSAAANVATPVVAPAGKVRAGKATKRKSGGNPVGGAVAACERMKEGGAMASTDKLKEKLDMKENLEAYSRRVNKLKTEVTAMSDTIDLASFAGGLTPSLGESSAAGQHLAGEVKPEVKFQPPDLSIKGLLEKTRIPPSSAVKHEGASATSCVLSTSSSGSAVTTTASWALKAEGKDMVNGAKKRKTVNGLIIPSARSSESGPPLLLPSQGRDSVSHSSIPGSNPSSSASSSLPASSPQEGKPSSPWGENRLSLAQDLIRFHENPVLQVAPPVSNQVTVVSGGPAVNSPGLTNGDVFYPGQVESHRLQNNYSPISRPSSQSSTEGVELPTALSSAANLIPIAQSLHARNSASMATSAFLQPTVVTAGRMGTGGLLPLSASSSSSSSSSSVPITVTVDVGAMSGGSVTSLPLSSSTPISIRASPHQQQQQQHKAAAYTGSTPLLASALAHSHTASSSSSTAQAAHPVSGTPSTHLLLPHRQQVVVQQEQKTQERKQPQVQDPKSQHVVVQQDSKTQQVKLPPLLTRSNSRSKWKQAPARAVSVDMPTPPSTPTGHGQKVVVPVSVAASNITSTASAGPVSISALLNAGLMQEHAPQHQQAQQQPAAVMTVKTQQQARRRTPRTSNIQPRLVQQVTTAAATQGGPQLVQLSNGLIPLPQSDVSKGVGATRLPLPAAATTESVVQMAMVNGVPQPVRLAGPQAVQVSNGQKGQWKFFFVCAFTRSLSACLLAVKW